MPSVKHSPVIFLDGQYLKATPKLLKFLSPGVMKGFGAFETMLFSGRKILFLKEHFTRFKKGLRVCGFHFSYSEEAIKEIIHQTIHRNSLKCARVRLAMWKYQGKFHLSVVCLPFFSVPKIFRAVVSPQTSPLRKYPFLKTIDYRLFRQASTKAQQQGYDEVIFLNKKKEVVEGSRSNIFIVKDKTLYTPSLSSGCLEGVTRAIVIRLAKKLKIKTIAVSLHIDNLLSANEAFVTNALVGVMPLTVIGKRCIGDGTTGKITSNLKRAYQKQMGN